MIKVMLADDHAIVRKGLRQLLEETGFIQVVAEADDYPAIMKAVRANDLDVLVMDITMPGKNGVDVLKIVKGEKPKLAVLMLSMHPEDQYAVRALKAGASGYPPKTARQSGW